MANNVEIFGRNYNNGKTIAIKTDGSGSLTTILEGLNSTGTELNQIVVNDDGSINVVGAGGGGGNANLYNGAGTTPITATTIDTKNGIDVNIIGGGGGGGGNANLFNGAGTIPITATTIDDKSGIDTNIVGGTVAVSTLPDIAITNTSFEVSNFPATQPVSGSVSVNTISNYALENGNLLSIKEKLDPLAFTTIGPAEYLVVYDSISKSVLDNIKTNTDNLDNITYNGNNLNVNVSNIASTPLITGYALDSSVGTTNTKLDTLNTTLTNKHLDKTLDSVDITNQNINVNETIPDSCYDLLINGPTLWANSTPVVNPFFADNNGREGWYYSNVGNVANLSNIYWYANPTTGMFVENDMTFGQLSNFYSVITCDFVDNPSLTIPIFGVYSQPTGTNDFMPTFAHSRWVYTLSSVDRAKLRKGETLLVYSGASRPDVFNQLPSYKLQLSTQSGDCLSSEIIAYMTVNTQATTSQIGYLLQQCGYLNSAVGYNRNYCFKNSKKRVIENKLYDGLATEKTVGDIRNTTEQLTFSGTKLTVYDSDAKGALDDIKLNTDKLDSLTFSVGDLNVKVNNQITGFATETTLGAIKTQTDKLVFNGDNLKTEVGNQITGFATETTLGDIKTQTDKLVFNGDNLKTEVSNQITGFATETTLGGIKTQTDKLVFTGDDLNTVISNQITGFATETTLGGIKTQTDKLVFNGDNLKTEIGNQITGFATETTLGDIKTQTDKLKFNGDNLKTEVSNQITGFATETTLGAIKTQTDKLKFNGDNLKAEISNTSFDSKLRDGNNNIVTSTVYGIDGVRGLDVSIKNATQANPLYTAIDTTTVPLNTFVTNFPSTTQIVVSGDTPLSAVASSLYTNLRDATGVAIGVGGNPLNVEVSNSIVVETGTNALDVNITGGTITGADGKAYLYSGNEASAITATTNGGGKVGIDSNIINASIDTHCYGSSNGTTWHHLSTDSNGQLNIHSKTQDGAGTDITSTALYTKTSLDTASDMYADFAGTRKNVSCDTNGKLQVNSFLKDAVGNNITSTDTTATTQSLDTASCLYTTDASVRSALTSTTISSKRALDVNVANTSAIPVSGTFYPATQPVSGSVNIGTGAVVAGVSVLGNDIPAGDRGVNTASCLYAKAPALSGVPETALTCILNGSRAYLETRDEDAITNLTTINTSIGTTNSTLSTTNSTLSTINGKLSTTTNTTTGLNVYPILPLGKTYTMSGVGNTGSYIVFAGSALSTLTFTSQTWGLSAPKSWYAKCSAARTLNYEYIDDTGATGTGTIALTAGVYSGILPLQGGGSGTNKIVGINKWWTTTNMALNETMFISATSASDSNAIAGGGTTYSNIGVFTCPAGCRAFISSVNVGLGQGTNQVADTVRLFHFTTTGIRTVRHVIANVTTSQSYNINSGNAYGSIGGWLEPGEAFIWAGQSGDVNITQRNISCQIMCINY